MSFLCDEFIINSVNLVRNLKKKNSLARERLTSNPYQDKCFESSTITSNLHKHMVTLKQLE